MQQKIITKVKINVIDDANETMFNSVNYQIIPANSPTHGHGVNTGCLEDAGYHPKITFCFRNGGQGYPESG